MGFGVGLSIVNVILEIITIRWCYTV